MHIVLLYFQLSLWSSSNYQIKIRPLQHSKDLAADNTDFMERLSDEPHNFMDGSVSAGPGI